MLDDIRNVASDIDGDEKGLLQKLLEKIGPAVYDQPFQRIIDSAISPVMADKYVSWLGYDNEIASQVRAAVRIKNQFPETWKSMMETDLRPSYMFDFEESYIYNLGIKVNSGMKIADYIRPIHLPFFLHDIEYADGTGRMLTSFDHDGSKSVKIIQTDDLTGLFPSGYGIKQFQKPFGTGLIEVIPGDSTEGVQWGWRMDNSPYTSVFSHSVVITLPDKFPIFGKAAHLHHDCGKRIEEDVWLFIRQDLGLNPYKRRQLGWIEYERKIHTTCYVDVVLRVRFKLNLDGERIASELINAEVPILPRPNFFLGVNTGTVSLENASDLFPPKEIGEAMSTLSELANKMLSQKHHFFLPRLFGDGITEEPIDELAKIILREREA